MLETTPSTISASSAKVSRFVHHDFYSYNPARTPEISSFEPHLDWLRDLILCCGIFFRRLPCSSATNSRFGFARVWPILCGFENYEWGVGHNWRHRIRFAISGVSDLARTFRPLRQLLDAAFQHPSCICRSPASDSCGYSQSVQGQCRLRRDGMNSDPSFVCAPSGKNLTSTRAAMTMRTGP